MPPDPQSNTEPTLEMTDLVSKNHLSDNTPDGTHSDTSFQPTAPARTFHNPQATKPSIEPDNQSTTLAPHHENSIPSTTLPSTLQPITDSSAQQISETTIPSDLDMPSVNPPVFHNPEAAMMTSHLEEFGSVPMKPNATATPQPSMNLAPHYDVFVEHGTSEIPPNIPLTLFGKIALALKLNKLFSRHNLKYAGVGLFSFAIFLLIFNFQTLSVQFNYFIRPPEPSAPVASTSPTPSVEPAVAEIGGETVPPGDVIIIPKIKVDNVPVIFEASAAEAAIQKSLQNGVVHYAGTALPGEKSNIVIVGHSSNDWWEPGNYKFIFALLEKLVPGDQIQMNYKERKYVFEVTNSKVVEPSEISVLQPTSEPQLTLITCTPPGTSWKRLIVTAKQIAPLPKPVKDEAQANQPAKVEAALPGNAPSIFDQIKQLLGFGDNKKQSGSDTQQKADSNQAQIRS
ncbi:MAG: sortase [bacterium]